MVLWVGQQFEEEADAQHSNSRIYTVSAQPRSHVLIAESSCGPKQQSSQIPSLRVLQTRQQVPVQRHSHQPAEEVRAYQGLVQKSLDSNS